MWVFNSLFGKAFEVIFYPFRSMSPWVGMCLISLLTALLMLFVFRLTSNQQGIRRVKNKIKAHLLELRLFKDNLGLSLKAQANIFRYNLTYIGYSAKPLLVMIVPLLLILIQLNFWFGYQSLSPAQKTLVKVKLDESHDPMAIDISLAASLGLDVETPPLRIEEEREVSWRIRPSRNGLHELTLSVNGQKVTKKVAVGAKPLARISPKKVRDFLDELFNPGESPLPRNLPLKTWEVVYPPKKMNLFGWHIHWLIVYFVLSIIFAFAFKGVFRVEI